MSKMDGLRAMREAKYARAAAGAAKTAKTAARPKPARAEPAEPAAVAPPPERDADPAADRLCGHRAISGRTCTREAGHAAKSHRYS